MEQVVNEVYTPLFTQKPRYFILMGGRGAGRSTVASQFALAKLVAKEYFRCAIMRYVLGDIRNSIYREITDRADENGITEALSINDSLMSIEYGVNTINAVGFKKSSGDQKAKLKSLANYNCVIIEEADEIPEAAFMQLDDSLRTLKGDIKIILLLNPPPKSHWIIKRWFNMLPSGVPDFYIPELKKDVEDVCFIRTSYKDNLANLDATTVKRYENYKQSKPAHYYNMIEGLVPETVQGRIYNNWVEIDLIPFGARKERTGADFGWFPDPAAGVDVWYYNGGYIFDEVFYQTEMSNRDIGNFLLNQEQKKLVVADSAEPKSINEIKGMGVTIVPCEKGADSVMYGIGLIQGEAISYTKRSLNLKKEYENYALKTDRDGEILAGQPKEGNDHCFAPETVVFTPEGYRRIDELSDTGLIWSEGTFRKYDNVHKTRTNAETVSLRFSDQNTLTVTPDHLVLLASGEWIEAGLLLPLDKIQSGTYGTNIQRKGLQTISWRTILKSWFETIAQGRMGISQWYDSIRYAHTPQGRQYRKQFNREFRIEVPTLTLKRTLDRGNEGRGTVTRCKDSPISKRVAWIKRGEGMALVTWDEIMGGQTIPDTGLCALPQCIQYQRCFAHDTVLPPELQNESPTKTVIGITRGRRAVTYNLDVEGTHSLWANGVIAHNCLDAARYAMASLVPMIQRRDFADNVPRLEKKSRPNPAR